MSLPATALGLFRTVAPRLADRVLGSAYPGAQRRLPEKDAREHALDALRALIAEVDFAKPGDAGTFRIPVDRVYAEWPQSQIKEPRLPAVGVSGFAQASVEHDFIGGPQLLEDTLGRYGRGTALAWVGTHEEALTLEPWCRSDPERQAVLAGLKAVFRASEARGSLLVPLPCYFDRVARFTLTGVTVPDEPESVATGKRRLLLTVALWVPDVLLVDAGTMRPVVRTAVVPPDGDL